MKKIKIKEHLHGFAVDFGILISSLMWAQALSRGSRAFSGTAKRAGSGRLGRSGSLDGAQKSKQMHLELELVAIGVGLQFVELEDGRKAWLCKIPNFRSICGWDTARVGTALQLSLDPVNHLSQEVDIFSWK